MTNKEFILKIIKYCCFGLLLFGIFVLSFGCGFYYRDSGHSLDLDTQSISLSPADTVTSLYTYESGNIYLPVSLFSAQTISTSNVVSSNVYSFKFKFSQGDSNGSLGTFYNLFISLDLNKAGVGTTGIVHQSIYDSWQRMWLGVPGSNNNIAIGYRVARNCNFDFYKVSMTTVNIFGGNSNFDSVRLDYYDSNDNIFSVSFALVTTSTLPVISDRTYFLITDITESNYYQTGYLDGYNAGDSAGQITGYDNGYEVGFNNGDLVGYQRGIEDTNQYTFLNLIGAVIDAPISAFVNLLDFEVFGFNMLNLCSSLLTLSLIILVVKFVLFRS